MIALLSILVVLYLAGLVYVMRQPGRRSAGTSRGECRRYTVWDPELGITWQVERWETERHTAAGAAGEPVSMLKAVPDEAEAA